MKIVGLAGLILTFGLMFGGVSAQNVHIEKFTKDIERHPNDADAYLGRGRAHLIQSSFDKAVADFTKAIEVSTHPYYLSQAMMNRGEVYVAQGNYPDAIADFGKIIEMKTAGVYKAQAYRNRADAYRKNGDNRTALTDANKAIALSSKSRSTGWKERLAKAYQIRSAIYCGLGDKAAAAAAADEKKQAELGLKGSNKCSSK